MSTAYPTLGINITNRIIDEARLKEAEVRLKELEYAHEKELREETIRQKQKKAYRISIAVFIGLLLFVLLIDRLRPLFIVIIIAGCIIFTSTKRHDTQNIVRRTQLYSSSKSRFAALLLCLIFGVFGFHRFYVGKIGSGLLFLITMGGFGIGWFIDLIRIACGVFRDSQGNYLKNW